MIKKFIIVGILCGLLSACSGTKESTYAAHGADLLSTGVALGLGAVELNPLGVGLIPAKIIVTEYISTLPEDEQPEKYDQVSSVTWGATANNLCVAVSLATGGGFMPLCIATGIATGYAYYKKAEERRGLEFLKKECVRLTIENPEMQCFWKGERIYVDVPEQK